MNYIIMKKKHRTEQNLQMRCNEGFSSYFMMLDLVEVFVPQLFVRDAAQEGLS